MLATERYPTRFTFTSPKTDAHLSRESSAQCLWYARTCILLHILRPKRYILPRLHMCESQKRAQARSPPRFPQSAQSIPRAQSEYSLPGPPSSQMLSELKSRPSQRHSSLHKLWGTNFGLIDGAGVGLIDGAGVGLIDGAGVGLIEGAAVFAATPNRSFLCVVAPGCFSKRPLESLLLGERRSLLPAVCALVVDTSAEMMRS